MSDALNPTRDVMLDIARSLPPAAQILAGICELLQDVNTDLDQIANEIRMDAALAARVIRISNSIVYGGNGSVSSVEEAVGRVGFSEVVRLVGNATVTRLVDRDMHCYHLGADVFREALLLHALASEALAENCGFNRHSAYVAGLLRGLGTMVLERYARGRIALEETYDPSVFETYRRWEMARFGLDGVSVTTMALDDWHFPDDVVGAIERHLAPGDSGDEIDRFANILNLAGCISTDHGRALPGEVIFWVRTPEKLASLGLDDLRFAQIAEQACSLFDQQRNALY